MNTLYRQPHQVIIPDNCTTKCDCGESPALHIDLDSMIITCDTCYENAAYFDRYTDEDILSLHGIKLDTNMYEFWNETYITK
jgi:hypothetical protein